MFADNNKRSVRYREGEPSVNPVRYRDVKFASCDQKISKTEIAGWDLSKLAFYEKT